MPPQPQQNVSLAAPGFLGINTQDSPTQLPIGFASYATNCVIDRLGRLASRKGLYQLTTNHDAISSVPATPEYLNVCGTFSADNGTVYTLCASDTKIFNQEAGGSIVELTVTTPPTAGDWQIAAFGNKAYLVQEGHTPLVFNPSTPTLVTDVVGPVGSASDPSCMAVGFGHVFYAGFSDQPSTVYWSDLGDGTTWAGGATGSINVAYFWPNNYDKIVAIHVHNNFLVIFGENSILVYQVPTGASGATAAIGPVGMTLVDTVGGLGCVSRDSVQSVGTDVFFLDNTGVRALGRTIQEKSMPMGDISRNVRKDITTIIKGAGASKNLLKGFYDPDESYYILFAPTASTAYVFDTREYLPDGAARVTQWAETNIRHATRDENANISYYAGKRGVFYLADSPDCYREDAYVGGGGFSSGYSNGFATGGLPGVDCYPVDASWATHPITFDQPATTKIPKQTDVTIAGGSMVDITFKWAFDFTYSWNKSAVSFTGSTPALYGVGQYGIAKYGPAGESLEELKFNMWGTGKNVRLAFDAEVLGIPISFQEINMQALLGRIV